VRGALDRTRAAELLAFWAARGALSGAEAQARLPEVVCLLRRDGAVVGASSVYPAELELIGGRRFWIYRSLLDRELADRAPAMIQATFAALQAEFDASPEAPIGLCILLAGPEEWRLWPQLQWANPPLLYAGYLGDGRQVRIAYFEGAEISMPPGRDTARFPVPESLPPPGYTIDLFAEQDAVSDADVIDLWQREGALRSPPEAKRRLSEVLLVATDRTGRLAGVATTYLRWNDQLRAELWYTRVFVAAAHRRSYLAIALAAEARDRLAQRFLAGTDRRGLGMLLDVENEFLKRAGPQAVWPLVGSIFIGEGTAGSHVRVNYFSGALAPEPESQA
jgi:hypothetical protein